jgi:hypothetical protein
MVFGRLALRQAHVQIELLIFDHLPVMPSPETSFLTTRDTASLVSHGSYIEGLTYPSKRLNQKSLTTLRASTF